MTQSIISHVGLVILSLAFSCAVAGQDSLKSVTEYPDFTSEGLRMIDLPSSLAQLNVKKDQDYFGNDGTEYDNESIGISAQGLVADYFGLKMSAQAHYSHGKYEQTKYANAAYTFSPGLFVALPLRNRALILKSDFYFSTYTSKSGNSIASNWKETIAWSAGLGYPVYLPKHQLALMIEAEYFAQSDTDGEIKDPEWTGLTGRIAPFALTGKALRSIDRTQAQYHTGTWMLDGASQLYWNHADRRPFSGAELRVFRESSNRQAEFVGAILGWKYLCSQKPRYYF